MIEDLPITHEDDKIVVQERTFYNGAADDGQPLYEGRIWSDLLKELSSIQIGEWRTKYDNRDIMDGVQWSVDIEYENDLKPRHYWGSNKFPYNFDSFLEIMDME